MCGRCYRVPRMLIGWCGRCVTDWTSSAGQPITRAPLLALFISLDKTSPQHTPTLLLLFTTIKQALLTARPWLKLHTGKNIVKEESKRKVIRNSMAPEKLEQEYENVGEETDMEVTALTAHFLNHVHDCFLCSTRGITVSHDITSPALGVRAENSLKEVILSTHILIRPEHHLGRS